MFSGPGKVDQGPVYRSASSRPVFMLPQAPNNDTAAFHCGTNFARGYRQRTDPTAEKVAESHRHRFT